VVAQALFNLVALEQTLNRYKMNLPLTAKRMTNKKGFCGQKKPKKRHPYYTIQLFDTSSVAPQRLLSTINPNQNNKPY